MKKIYVAALTGYAGKTLTTLGLAAHFRGTRTLVRYFKPVGALPHTVNGHLTDEDAWRVARFLEQQSTPEKVCPVVVTQDVLVASLRGRFKTPWSRIRRAWETVCQDADMCLVGGYGALVSGAAIGLSGVAVSRRLGCQVLLTARYGGPYVVDTILEARKTLGKRLLGVIINDVGTEEMEAVTTLVGPCLERRGIAVLGIIPHDDMVAAVAVSDLQELLGARIISGHQGMDRLVEHFLIGGMQVDKAMVWFRRLQRNAVIVGGDRADIQLAAIECGTQCLVLTGGFSPNEIILAKAEEHGVPILEVYEHTYNTARRVEQMSRKLRLRHPTKLQRAIDLFREVVDLERLESLIG